MDSHLIGQRGFRRFTRALATATLVAAPCMPDFMTGFPAELHAQEPMRAHADWRTVETAHFTVHYPRELEEWTLPVAQRLESIHGAVTAFVGNVPAGKVTVIVDDPLNISNASAAPGPVIVLWPTPADPRSMIGDNRGWGEMVALHEFAHVAHLARPTRNPRQRLLMRFLPFRIDPLWFTAPRWLTEGYATYVEGRLTGSGRPHGTWRPALLRQWALEGSLPNYGQLGEVGGFHGGHMAYLAGSAFLEWLVERNGEESLPALWRRMTARERRSFDDNFAGVFGAPPGELYGRFTAELTGSALEVERALESAGVVAGEQVQRRDWYTGDPALSPGGSLMALTIHEEGAPARVVVWRSEPDTLSDEQRLARERAIARDPEDVPGIEWHPPPREPVATLWSVGGRGHSTPRFLPDGVNVLVTRAEGLGDGRIRSDLFVWNHETGATRRITRGAGIRNPDPAPDGRSAAAIRCVAGSCDLVRVDLASGAISVLAAGSADRVLYRPRISPDGSRIVLAVQEGENWRLALVDAGGGALRFIGPADGANRFDAAFTPDGASVVAVSDASGIHNLELLDLATGAVTRLTRVTGAVMAPEPASTGWIYFLNIRSRAYDVHRVHPDSVSVPAGDVITGTGLAVPRARIARDTFPSQPIPAPRGYGIGPRQSSFFPLGVAGTQPASVGLSYVGSDPVGRLTVIAQLLGGERGAWRYGGVSAAWRGFPVSLEAELYSLAAAVADIRPELEDAELDVGQQGVTLSTSYSRDFLGRAWGITAGTSASRDGRKFADGGRLRRTLAFGELTARDLLARGQAFLLPELHAHFSSGTTGEAAWQRVLATGGITAGSGSDGVRASVQWGSTGTDAPLREQFAVGGIAPPVMQEGVFSQRISLPALPPGALTGKHVRILRTEVVDGSGMVPYYVVARSGGERRRVLGLESSGVTPPLTYLRIPSMRISAGAGYPLDGPTRKRVQFYGGITLIP